MGELFGIFIFCISIVSQLPGKSNQGQQVLIQGNQILHVARTLQGTLANTVGDCEFWRILSEFILHVYVNSCATSVSF